MDLEFYSAMNFLFNETSSPPINMNNRITNTNENSLSNSGGVVGGENSTMEPNNLSQSAAAVLANAAAAANIDDAEQTATPTFPVSLSRLELKLPILSSSSSDSELEEPPIPTAGTSAGPDGERVPSPPPNCAICLGRCKNKCFTDSCMHQFCFKCLCEWSKVKPECPLCKQTFKSIIHNVKSIDQFEEYHVQPPTVQIAHPSIDFPEMRLFAVVQQGHNRNQHWSDRLNNMRGMSAQLAAASFAGSASSGAGAVLPTSASGSSRSLGLAGSGGLRNQYVYRGELLDLYRQEYPDAIASSGTLSQLWRRYVYDRKLYAMPVADINGRFRDSSARFYRDNPSQIHRLMPWINRDIVCLLRQTQHDVTTVLESINTALTLMNILSPAFRRRLQPYLSTKTAHFIHELNNFARSPYDMIGYDRAVQYSTQTNNEDIVIEFSSSEESTDNENIDVMASGLDGGGTGGGSNNTRSTNMSTSSNASINAINLTIHNRLTSATNTTGSRSSGNGSSVAEAGNIQDEVSLVIDLRGESDNIEASVAASGNRTSTISSNFQDDFHQHSLEAEDIVMPVMLPSVSENIELTSGSSDECEFVLERKPPHLRTPEMVSLDSASDSDVVFVEESKPLNKTSFSSSEDEQNDAGANDHSGARVSTTTAATTTTTSSTSTRNKITALVEAKKRNHSANLVKNEQNDSQSEMYNVGASTSAALRLSLQKRVDKSDNSRKTRRDKYALRQSRMEQSQEPKRGRGKRLGSESSHSSTSSSSSTTSTSSTSSTSTTSNSTSSSSDEEYVVNSARRRKVARATSGGVENQRKRRKVKKTRKRKTTNTTATTNKRNTSKRRKHDEKNTTDDDSDDDDNKHMGKNFALVMAISERIKRQNQKHTNKAQAKEVKKHDDSAGGSEDGEDSWRIKAVNEPLRKQQQSECLQKSNERKRHRKPELKSATDKGGERNEKRRRKHDKQDKEKNQKESGTSAEYKKANDGTSSDESDNINLIQLKSKLIGQDTTSIRNRENDTEELITNEREHETDNNESPYVNSSFNETLSTSAMNSSTNSTLIDHHPPEERNTSATSTANSSTTNTSMEIHNLPSSPKENKNIIGITTKIEPQNSSDSSDSNDDHDDEQSNVNTNEEILPSAIGEYHYHHNRHNSRDDDDDDNDNDVDETSRNAASSMNLVESNVFVDGTSMSNATTTTTDTILHDAAEQISSAAVNFYNPQQTFNTADFAVAAGGDGNYDDDENTTNSSSSDSSISSITTSLSSSSNSSSSNTNGFVNYEHP